MNNLKKEFYTKTIKLNPCYDGAKSFYNKAYLKIECMREVDNNGYVLRDAMVTINLYSYNTKVLTILKDIQKHKNDAYILYTPIDDVYYSDEYYTRTTMRHVKECLRVYFFNYRLTPLLDASNYKKSIILDNAVAFKTWRNIEQ